MRMHLGRIMARLAEFRLGLLDQQALTRAPMWFVTGRATADVRVLHSLFELLALVTGKAGLGNVVANQERGVASGMRLMAVPTAVALTDGRMREGRFGVVLVVIMASCAKSTAQCY